MGEVAFVIGFIVVVLLLAYIVFKLTVRFIKYTYNSFIRYTVARVSHEQGIAQMKAALEELERGR